MLSERGHAVICGGYGGSMEAVSRGAHERGGHVIGITVAPWQERLAANPYVKEEISAETLFARLEGLIAGEALIALRGGAGTLGEVALAWNLRQMDLMAPKPIILVGPTWQRLLEVFREHLIINERDLSLLTPVATIEDAVAALEGVVESRGEWFG
jgi:uncharacterized protein (TIGR00725 family)